MRKFNLAAFIQISTDLVRVFGRFANDGEENMLISTSNEAIPSESEASDDDDIRFQRRPKIYKCKYDGCDKVFDRPCRLEEHIRQHTGERPFICDEPDCGKSFQRDYHLSRHKNDSHANVRNHACSYEGCDQRFATSQRLRNHEKSHEKNDQYRCTDFPPCNEQFRKKSTLQAHISEYHLGRNPYTCTHNDYFTGQPCVKGFKTSQALNRHIASHHNGPRFTCTACSSTPTTPTMTESSIPADPMSPITAATSTTSSVAFPTHQALQQHLKAHHPDLLPSAAPKPPKPATFACPHPGCASAFNKRSNLTAHERSVHAQTPRFVCGAPGYRAPPDIAAAAWDARGCGAPFAHKHLLDEHVRTRHLGMAGAWARSGAAARRRARRAAAAADRAPPSDPPAAADALLGAVEPRVECWACQRCGEAFAAEDRLAAHCAVRHGLAEVEVHEVVLEARARAGGAFWIGGIDPRAEDDAEEEEERVEAWFDGQEEHAVASAVAGLAIDPMLCG